MQRKTQKSGGGNFKFPEENQEDDQDVNEDDENSGEDGQIEANTWYSWGWRIRTLVYAGVGGDNGDTGTQNKNNQNAFTGAVWTYQYGRSQDAGATAECRNLAYYVGDITAAAYRKRDLSVTNSWKQDYTILKGYIDSSSSYIAHNFSYLRFYDEGNVGSEEWCKAALVAAKEESTYNNRTFVNTGFCIAKSKEYNDGAYVSSNEEYTRDLYNLCWSPEHKYVWAKGTFSSGNKDLTTYPVQGSNDFGYTLYCIYRERYTFKKYDANGNYSNKYYYSDYTGTNDIKSRNQSSTSKGFYSYERDGGSYQYTPYAPSTPFGVTFSGWKFVNGSYSWTSSGSSQQISWASFATNLNLANANNNSDLRIIPLWTSNNITVTLYKEPYDAQVSSGSDIKAVGFASSLSSTLTTNDYVSKSMAVAYGNSSTGKVEYYDIDICANPKDGYAFTKWTNTNSSTAAAVSTSAHAAVKINSSARQTWYAWAEPKIIKLTLNYNDGSGITRTLYYKYGVTNLFTDSSCTQSLSSSARNNYRPDLDPAVTLKCASFSGYYTQTKGGTYLLSSSLSMANGMPTYTTADTLTLYGRCTFKIDLDTSGGTLSTTGIGRSYVMYQYNCGFVSANDQEISTLTEVPTKFGYTFAGYFEEDSGKKVFDSDGNNVAKSTSGYATSFRTVTTLVAHWEGTQFQVNVCFSVSGSAFKNVPDMNIGTVGKMTFEDTDGTRSHDDVDTQYFKEENLRLGGKITFTGYKVNSAYKGMFGIMTTLNTAVKVFMGNDTVEGKALPVSLITCNLPMVTSGSKITIDFSPTEALLKSALDNDYQQLNIFLRYSYSTVSVKINPGVLVGNEKMRLDNLFGKVQVKFTSYSAADRYNLQENIVATIDFATGEISYENRGNSTTAVSKSTATVNEESITQYSVSVVKITDLQITAIEESANGRKNIFLGFVEDLAAPISKPESAVNAVESISAATTVPVWFANVVDNPIKYDADKDEYYFEDGLYPQEYVTAQDVLSALSGGNGQNVGKFEFAQKDQMISRDIVQLDGEKYVSFDVSSDTTFMAGEDLVSLHAGDVAWFKFVPIRWVLKFDKVAWNGYGTSMADFVVVSEKVLGFGSVALKDSEGRYNDYGWDFAESVMQNCLQQGSDWLDVQFGAEGFDTQKFVGGTSGMSNNSVATGTHMTGAQTKMRVASMEDVKNVTDNMRAEASDLVAFLMSDGGCVEYWTRDLHSLGNGKAVSGAGASVVRPLDFALGVRFAMTMTGGTNLIGILP